MSAEGPNCVAVAEGARNSHTLVDWFEQRARVAPEHFAVISRGARLTYSSLDIASANVARRLHGVGLGRGDVVAVLLDRTPAAIAAMFGVLRAGCAYLPLDPRSPTRRLQRMLDDAQASAVVMSTDRATNPELEGATLVDITSATAAGDGPPLDDHPTPDEVAYVIYTSGSTGFPKGVEVTHRSAWYLAESIASLFEVKRHDRVAQVASLAFDASIWEVLMAIGATATLCIVETLDNSPTQVADQLRSFEVTVATLPPTLLARMTPGDLPRLRTVVSAGESCPTDVVRDWAPNRRFVNAYGPTETTVCATMADCSEHDSHRPWIGPPLPHVRTYVLDSEMRPLPDDAFGELYIGGAGVALGYRRAPGQTATAFVPDPFGEPGSRLYRSGDLCARHPTGALEYRGRLDDQVKIRGYRVELGEVERALLEHPHVREAAVCLVERNGVPYLVAFLVGHALDAANGQLSRELRRAVAEGLPEYMQPNSLVVRADLPFTTSGKVDRAALVREWVAGKVGGVEPAATLTEATVLRVWREHLGASELGRKDNFFEKGGHSLVAATVTNALRGMFEVELPIRLLFENPVAAEFARRIDEAMAASQRRHTPI